MQPIDTGGTMLESHRPCIRCSYDLHGLPLSGNCPECGVPVERSLRGDLLQFADETYRGTLLRGVSLIMYDNMFSWIQKALVTIRDEGSYVDPQTSAVV